MANINPIRALRIIEGIVHERCDEDPLLRDIYMIAHQAAHPNCRKNHTDWTDLTLETEANLVKNNIIPPWVG